jgi:2,3-bisphosphoglycerate-independent phosphoglycerate mutase
LKGAHLRSDGRLADIIPTALRIMGIEQPKEMTGRSLVNG